MSYKLLGALFLFLVLWVGVHLVTQIREQARVDALPKTVAIRGPYSAKTGIDEAKRIADMWDPEGRLQCVVAAFGGDVSTNDPGVGADGLPTAGSGWIYRFFSSRRGWFLDVTLWPDGRCEASSFNGINYLDTQPLPEEFLDSTAALSIAEELYGQEYRREGELFRLPTRLTTWQSVVPGPRDPVPHRATWQIHYRTRRDRGRVDLFLTLDAVTGEVLSAVESVNTQTRVLRNGFGR